MRKRWLLFFTLVWLAACGTANHEQGLVPHTVTPASLSPAATAAATSQPADPTAAVGAVAPTDAGYVAARTVEEAAQVQPGDHVAGAAEPLVTIIEYGDFQ